MEILVEKLKKNTYLKLNEFQLKNLSMAIEAAKLNGLKEDKIFSSLKKIKDVNGRLELIRTFSNKAKVYVDFAHTPDALEKALKSLQSYYGRDITLVFGCGGDRDFKKRPLMGKIAFSNCKKIYVTDDNPRSEDPSKIRSELMQNSEKFIEISDRGEAISHAISKLSNNDSLLICGKGHEGYIQYKDKRVSFSDHATVSDILSK